MSPLTGLMDFKHLWSHLRLHSAPSSVAETIFLGNLAGFLPWVLLQPLPHCWKSGAATGL